MTDKVKMSFICPCYNDGKTIERLVDSLLDQDFKDFEIIIVNDGSTDNSKEIIEAIKGKDTRIKTIHLEKNEGACFARNIGAKKAKGEYYSFLPADAFLYPGMLRIWIEQLDEYPDYDFLYGGYRFVDENYNRIQNGDYLFNSFDPYLLETTNYIDGSFPIRAKAFWEVADLMNKQGKQTTDGLWDPTVKSLQDWDFWLSVVKEGGRKGIYIQDIFFETVLPHTGGLSYDSSEHWLERMDYIKQKHNIPIRKACVASLGASWHAKRLAYMLNADFLEMPSYKPNHYDVIYVIGFYPEFAAQQDMMFLNNFYDHGKGRNSCKKIVHLIGTDIWQLRKISLDGLQIWKNYFNNAIDELLVEADFTQMEVKEILGIEAKIVPIPPAKLYEIQPLPEKFTIACYQPAMNSQFYNPALMEEVAKEFPDIEFKFFGNPMQLGKHKDIKNIEYVGYINDMEAFIKECSAIMRFPYHDGLPISILEFILAGRYAILNVPVKDTFFVPYSDKASICEAIKKAKEKCAEGVNKEGADYWREELNHDKYRERIKELFNYNEKEYWEKRAISWNQQADQMPIEKEEIKEFYDELKPESLLDLGCGNGKWIPIFKEWGLNLVHYMGVDISGKLIEIAQNRYPELEKSQLFMESAENLNLDKKYDLVFSYTTLEHIPKENMQKVADNLKKIGKKLLLIEPINFETKYYCHSHDYKKYFNVIKEKQLKDKTIMFIDNEN